ncbi:hypothetical protein K461DRAFT_63718 [Myriangium duriaei CBS 260.36]|uniref:Uncharacterized protein n=1 Tax=Myriangium duriaei CBS 260.36 TaxID=1168546 RepID=A0A9P4IV43_9PEZI|nr:hypothetical protein K461DRAFT_63718 [Myriangium duriaei CBS 260.36]
MCRLITGFGIERQLRDAKRPLDLSPAHVSGTDGAVSSDAHGLGRRDTYGRAKSATYGLTCSDTHGKAVSDTHGPASRTAGRPASARARPMTSKWTDRSAGSATDSPAQTRSLESGRMEMWPTSMIQLGRYALCLGIISFQTSGKLMITPICRPP